MRREDLAPIFEEIGRVHALCAMTPALPEEWGDGIGFTQHSRAAQDDEELEAMRRSAADALDVVCWINESPTTNDRGGRDRALFGRHNEWLLRGEKNHRRTEMAGLLLQLAAATHVPTYCADACCTLPRTHTTSQVVYMKGTGGVEVAIDRFDRDGELIDIDAVFRDRVDPASYALHVGCGRCTNFSATPVRAPDYQPPEFEPFTQTAYRSAFAKEDRVFDTSQLASCAAGYFTISLVDHHEEASIVWAPVIGAGETFTFAELLAFPVYILRNHGPTWNNLGFTYWSWLAAAAFALLARNIWRLRRCGRPLTTYVARSHLYEVALLSFLTAALEEATHLIYVHIGVPISSALYVAIFGVIFVGQGLPAIFTMIVWSCARARVRACSCAASALWAPLEVLTGFSFLFLFGSGFFIGPAAIMLAGTARAVELCRHRPCHRPCRRRSRAPVATAPPTVRVVEKQIVQIQSRATTASASLGFF